MALDTLNRMEHGSGDDHRNLLATDSHDLQKPLIKHDGSTKPKGHHHRRHLKSRRDAILPNSGYAIFSTLVVALGPLSLGFALGFTSPTQVAIVRDLSLSVAEFSTFGSILNVGCMLGAIISGRLADYFGRKRVITLQHVATLCLLRSSFVSYHLELKFTSRRLLKALLLAVVPLLAGWVIIVLAKTAMPLVLARTLIGFGGGIISFTVPMYIGETAPKHLRGTLGAMNQLAITVGITLAYLCGILVDWRLLAAFGAVPELVLILALFFIPESPRWLAKAGKKEELTACLQRLRGVDYNIANEIADIQAAMEASSALPSVKLVDLKQPKLFRPLVAGVGLMVLQQFGGINAVMLYSSAIFSTAGISNPNVASLAMGTLQVFMTLAAAGLMDKAGRRILLMVSSGGMALSSFLVGFSFYLRTLQPERMSDALNTFICMLALVSLLVYIATFSLGMGAIPWIIMSEIFPAHVKGVAGSVATLVNWSCSYGVTMIFNYMLLWSSAGSFWIFALECVGTVVFVALYVPETRGRTLEQIEASFR